MSLDERKKKILGAVVRDYVDTVRPVGSEDLASRHAWGVKSATIRNELAELSDLGYLRQPHTSAGRIPSDRGYRFYVDHLMVAHEVVLDNSMLKEKQVSLELDFMLRQTCAMLTRMTSYTSVATPPRPADTNVNQIFLSPAREGRLLMVILLSTGQVLNHLLPDMMEQSAPDIISLTSALHAAYAGKSLDAIADANFSLPAAPIEFNPDLRATYTKIELAIRHSAHQAAEKDSVYMEGASEILRHPEFRDADKLDGVLETLQKRTSLFHSLSRALRSSNVVVVIGSENQVATMQECSVVSASYFIGTRERGTIGVVGPTRMDYDRAMPAVSFFAHTLTQTLSHHTNR